MRTVDKITLKCLNPKCPRTKKIERAKDIPKCVVEIRSYCPWHEKEGWKAYPEIFYDAEGFEIDPITGKR